VRLIIEETWPDYIFASGGAAYPALSKRDPWFTLENNIRAQLNVLEALRETGLSSGAGGGVVRGVRAGRAWRFAAREGCRCAPSRLTR